MIIAIGTDIVEIARIAELLERQPERFVERVLCSAEREQYAARSHSVAFVATRFAAKEAIAKALGTGIGRGVSFQDMQITNDDKGAPHVTLTGGAAEVVQSRGGERVLISLADERDYAIAYATLC